MNVGQDIDRGDIRMTERKAWECDDCGAVDYSEYGEYIRNCFICNKDICVECQKQHARDECGF